MYTRALRGAAISDEPKDKKDEALERRESELNAREHELNARKETLDTRELTLKGSAWTNPLVLALFAAALGLIGNAVVAVANVYSNREVEKQKLQSNLIVEAIKTTQENACKNLVFFVSLNLIDDSADGAIKRVCQPNSPDAPSLPPPGKVSSIGGGSGSFEDDVNSLFFIHGSVEDADTHTPVAGVKVTTSFFSIGVMSNLNGNFALPLLALSNTFATTVHLEKNGYTTTEKEVPALTPSLHFTLKKSVSSKQK